MQRPLSPPGGAPPPIAASALPEGFDQHGGRIEDQTTETQNEERRTAQVFELALWARDLLDAFVAWRDVMPPLFGAQAALIDTVPIALDTRQYSRATALGLAGRLGGLAFDTVIFRSGGRFAFARDEADQTCAEVAFILPVTDKFDVVSDVAAWHPETDRLALLFGEVGTLGLPALDWPVRTPPRICESLIDWLTADDAALFIVDYRLAAQELAAAPVAVPDHQAAQRLRARLAPYARRPPQIYVPKKSERQSA